VTYPQTDAAGQLMLSYAISVHRSQGSEYPVAIVPVALSQGRLLVRNLLYTAVTRASEMVCLVGQHRAIEQAVNTAINGTRRTGLLRKLRRFSG
jgi:exodeoxyribonuclease V alpha subunit